jgi:hypothetical protein
VQNNHPGLKEPLADQPPADQSPTEQQQPAEPRSDDQPPLL